MSALGVLPPVDAAVHADTGHERAETYALAKKWTPWLEKRGVRVVTVQAAMAPYMFNRKGIFLPVYTLKKNGKRGQLLRQCTDRWKIQPVNKWIRANMNGSNVDLWLGITLDEVERAKLNPKKYITNVFPFLFLLDRWRRGDVIDWLIGNNLDVPVKSSCTFCQFHDHSTWREIQTMNSEDWQKALLVDYIIRNKRPGYLCYLTPERRPLPECDFRSQEEHGQLTIWETEECSGMCFL